MAQRAIIIYPDQRLRRRADPVTAFDGSLRDLVDDLVETLSAHSALGLSAPQVADGRAVLVIAPPGSTAPGVFINPVITSRARWGFVEESCLSAPGVVGTVMRPTRVSVRAVDVAGTPFDRELDGMAAVCLQHEVDHLEGRLFFDRFSPLGRMRARRRLRRFGDAGARAATA